MIFLVYLFFSLLFLFTIIIYISIYRYTHCVIIGMFGTCQCSSSYLEQGMSLPGNIFITFSPKVGLGSKFQSQDVARKSISVRSLLWRRGVWGSTGWRGSTDWWPPPSSSVSPSLSSPASGTSANNLQRPGQLEGGLPNSSNVDCNQYQHKLGVIHEVFNK